MINVMRNILILMILCLFPFCGMQAQDSLSSAGSMSLQASDTVRQLNTVPSADSINPDSLLESKVDTLTFECHHLQEAQEFQGYLLIGVGGFSLIMLVMVVVLWTKLNKVNSKRKAMRVEFEEFKKHPLTQGHLNYLRSLFMEDVDNKIANNNQLFNKVQLVEASPSLKEEPIVENVPVIRYFATNSGSFFVKAFTEKNPTTAFKVTFSNSSMSEGEFELIDLNKIKSSDSIKQVVDFVSDSKKIELAKEAILREKGKVVKNGNSWKVISKLKLKLY